MSPDPNWLPRLTYCHTCNYYFTRTGWWTGYHLNGCPGIAVPVDDDPHPRHAPVVAAFRLGGREAILELDILVEPDGSALRDFHTEYNE